jgi:hypothetical protein
MLSINQHFSKHCSCHLQGQGVLERVLEASYRAGSKWRVRFEGADWLSSGTGCYPMGEGHAVEEKKLRKNFIINT